VVAPTPTIAFGDDRSALLVAISGDATAAAISLSLAADVADKAELAFDRLDPFGRDARPV